MQYVVFEKKCMRCTMGSEAKPLKAGEFSRIFVLKVTVQSVRLLLTISYSKSLGAGCITCSPIIFPRLCPRSSIILYKSRCLLMHDGYMTIIVQVKSLRLVLSYASFCFPHYSCISWLMLQFVSHKFIDNVNK